MSFPEALKFTYEDYLATPDDRRYELIDGDLLLTPAPTPYHQQVLANLEDALRHFVHGQGLGRVFLAPCDIVLSRYDVVQPDIFFIRSDRLSIVTEKNISGAPDLAVEVLSPSTEERDRDRKTKLYARAGVRELWIADPAAKSIEVFVLSEGGFRREALYAGAEVLRSPLLPGLEIPPSRIF
ncbi:MAG: Uma2 family endonuclease [Thermoanaerobaculia bacterium]